MWLPAVMCDFRYVIILLLGIFKESTLNISASLSCQTCYVRSVETVCACNRVQNFCVLWDILLRVQDANNNTRRAEQPRLTAVLKTCYSTATYTHKECSIERSMGSALTLIKQLQWYLSQQTNTNFGYYYWHEPQALSHPGFLRVDLAQTRPSHGQCLYANSQHHTNQM